MKTAVVTGGAQGIGKAICLKLISEGVYTFVFDHDREALSELFEEAGDSGLCKTVICDVGKEESLIASLDSVLKSKSSVSYLVNNAAISDFKPLEKLTLETWNRVLAVNLSSVFLASRRLSPALKASRGAIVNLCSTRAFMSEPNTEAYSASKGGVFALTHALAMSLQPHVRVNCISPGWIDVTGWQKKSKKKNISWDEKHHRQHPAGRIGKPEDIAELTWYLLSDKSGFITGQNFFADGGMTRKMIYS